MSQSEPLEDPGLATEGGKGHMAGQSKPLPPIGSKSTSRTQSAASHTTFSSMHRNTPGETETQSEMDDQEAAEAVEDPGELQQPTDSVEISSIERRHLVAFDGVEHLMISMACQTEWSWMEDMRLRSSLGGGQFEGAGSDSRSSVSSSPAPKEKESDNETIMSARRGKTSSRGGAASQSQRSGRSGTSTKSGKAADSLIPPYPEPRLDDEFGIPLDESSDESEEHSDVEEAAGDKQTGPPGTAVPSVSKTPAEEFKPSPSPEEREDRAQRHLRAVEEGIIPSVGPPQALQYLRESEIPNNPPQTPAHRIAGIKLPIGSSCQFCGQPVPPLPSLEEQANKAPEELFCCSEYRALLDYALQHPLNKEEEGKLIDIKPHPPYGSQKARKEAKERAEKRNRERELARQQASMMAAQANFMQGGSSRPVSVFSTISDLEKARKDQEMKAMLARQMKTINYQLSSMKCLEEGWTLRPPSPLFTQEDPDIFVLDPSAAADRGELFGLSPRYDVSMGDVFVKYYPNGRKFLTLFEDGTGNVFYPSGNPAIVISRADPGSVLFTYVVLDDAQVDDTILLAVFDTACHGTVYYPDGNIRVSYDQIMGLDLERTGARRRVWLWGGQLHAHAPPFQPLCLALNRAVGLRMTSREQVLLSFHTQTRSCKINVGAKLKLINPSLLPMDTLDEDKVLLDEVRNRVATCLERAETVLKYPHHPRLDRLPTSLHLRVQKEKVESQKAKLQARHEAAVK